MRSEGGPSAPGAEAGGREGRGGGWPAPGDVQPSMGTICRPLCCHPGEPAEWAGAAGSCGEGLPASPGPPLPVLTRQSVWGTRESVHSLLFPG